MSPPSVFDHFYKVPLSFFKPPGGGTEGWNEDGFMERLSHFLIPTTVSSFVLEQDHLCSPVRFSLSLWFPG